MSVLRIFAILALWLSFDMVALLSVYGLRRWFGRRGRVGSAWRGLRRLPGAQRLGPKAWQAYPAVLCNAEVGRCGALG